MTETFWNGEPAVAVRGSGVVQPSSHPAFWGKHLVGFRVRVVRVEYAGHPFYLSDLEGEGWEKVTTGRGSPRRAHRNLSVKDFSDLAGHP